jgi:hypothetical protein
MIYGLWIGRCGEILIPSRKLLLFILNHLAHPQGDPKSQIQGSEMAPLQSYPRYLGLPFASLRVLLQPLLLSWKSGVTGQIAPKMHKTKRGCSAHAATGAFQSFTRAQVNGS